MKTRHVRRAHAAGFCRWLSSCFRKEELAFRKLGTKTCTVMLRRKCLHDGRENASVQVRSLFCCKQKVKNEPRTLFAFKNLLPCPYLTVSPSGTCGRGRGGRTLYGEGCLHHQLHLHGAQPAVGVRGHVAQRHQLVAVPEVPDVVDGGGGLQVTAGVVNLDSEDHGHATEEDVLRLVDGCLLGDADRNGDLV